MRKDGDAFSDFAHTHTTFSHPQPMMNATSYVDQHASTSLALLALTLVTTVDTGFLSTVSLHYSPVRTYFGLVCDLMQSSR